MKGVFQQLFAPWIYKVSISKEDSQKLFDYYVPEIEKEGPTLSLPRGWQCRVYTSFENADNTGVDFSLFKRTLDKYVNSFLEETVAYETAFNFEENSNAKPWYNMYLKGSWQERHNHLPGTSFSAVYYLKFDPEKHLPTCFHTDNKLQPMMARGTPLKQGSVPYWYCKELFFPKITQGDLVIFPSPLDHTVPVQTSDDPRMTIAFNF